jgi:uncharacterized protein CbrC (UPF0167 family)
MAQWPRGRWTCGDRFRSSEAGVSVCRYAAGALIFFTQKVTAQKKRHLYRLTDSLSRVLTGIKGEHMDKFMERNPAVTKWLIALVIAVCGAFIVFLHDIRDFVQWVAS